MIERTPARSCGIHFHPADGIDGDSSAGLIHGLRLCVVSLFPSFVVPVVPYCVPNIR
jgi:hypothetical protein